MTTPLATIADALVEFILSLLRDPNAVEELNQDPEGVLARNGLSGVCVEDVRAVKPVVVDHPHVHPKPPGPPPPPGPPDVVREFTAISQSFHFDNRATIIDQSVNQNIWAEGDVTQIFDQEAIVASGDHSVAAGDDASVDNSETNTTIGDVAIGNTETNVDVSDSFNDSSTNTEVNADVDVSDSFNDSSTNTDVDVDVSDSFQSTQNTEVTTDVDISDSTVFASSVDVDVDVPIEIQFEEP